MCCSNHTEVSPPPILGSVGLVGAHAQQRFYIVTSEAPLEGQRRVVAVVKLLLFRPGRKHGACGKMCLCKCFQTADGDTPTHCQLFPDGDAAT